MPESPSPDPAPGKVVAGVRWIHIYDDPQLVRAPDGTVYSSRPRTTTASDDREYYLKGPDVRVVVAEAVGYQLADAVGVDVPEWALCRDPANGQVLFASAGIRVRSGLDVLLHSPHTANPDLLARCMALDCWIANDDRNIGSVVAEPLNRRSGAAQRLYAIDFEQAQVLRGTDRFTVAAREVRDFTPRGVLADYTAGLGFPGATCARIGDMTAARVRAMFELVEQGVGPIEWADGAAHFLGQRAGRIEALLREVWHG
ncbi:hypothetical protein tb265_00400 [Gemmatimonadetes bacterium T265]|nr:hypothetical protein tb265_00400 [Gemmatimonadetes bacterium T265]